MTKTQKKALINRVKSLLWRAFMMGFAFSLEIIISSLSTLEMSEVSTVIIGLVLGEVSKHLNNLTKK